MISIKNKINKFKIPKQKALVVGVRLRTQHMQIYFTKV